MSITDRLGEIEAVADYLDDPDLESEVYSATAALRAILGLADEYERAAEGGEPEHVRAANVAAYIRRAMETTLGEARP